MSDTTYELTRIRQELESIAASLLTLASTAAGAAATTTSQRDTLNRNVQVLTLAVQRIAQRR